MKRYFHFHNWKFQGVSNNTYNESRNKKNNVNNKESFICGLIIFIAILFLMVFICILIRLHHKKHEHIYSNYGSSTTTCKKLGETTYWCIYHYDNHYECNEKKVVKDTEYKNCSYIKIKTLSEKLEENKYLYKCSWCGREEIKISKNSYGWYGKANIRDAKGLLEKESDIKKGEFSCLCYAGSMDYGDFFDLKLKAVLLLFDENGNKIYQEEKNFNFTSQGLRFVYFYIDSFYMDKYYTHRWNLRPQ